MKEESANTLKGNEKLEPLIPNEYHNLAAKGNQKLCVDDHGLNCICMEIMYPLPLMREMLGYLSKGKIVTKLDLREAYYRVRIKGDE